MVLFSPIENEEQGPLKLNLDDDFFIDTSPSAGNKYL